MRTGKDQYEILSAPTEDTQAYEKCNEQCYPEGCNYDTRNCDMEYQPKLVHALSYGDQENMLWTAHSGLAYNIFINGGFHPGIFWRDILTVIHQIGIGLDMEQYASSIYDPHKRAGILQNSAIRINGAIAHFDTIYDNMVKWWESNMITINKFVEHVLKLYEELSKSTKNKSKSDKMLFKKFLDSPEIKRFEVFKQQISTELKTMDLFEGLEHAELLREYENITTTVKNLCAFLLSAAFRTRFVNAGYANHSLVKEYIHRRTKGKMIEENEKTQLLDLAGELNIVKLIPSVGKVVDILKTQYNN